MRRLEAGLLGDSDAMVEEGSKSKGKQTGQESEALKMSQSKRDEEFEGDLNPAIGASGKSSKGKKGDEDSDLLRRLNELA